MSKCPVCDTELILDYRDTLDGWCLMEEAEHCPKCGYAVEYHHGHGAETIGDDVIEWHHDDTLEQSVAFAERSREACARRRAALAQALAAAGGD